MPYNSKEKLAEYGRQWYRANRERLLAKMAVINAVRVDCQACNCSVAKSNYENHLLTTKHFNSVNGRPVILEKNCYSCRVIQPVENFHRSSSKIDGYQGCCKECKSKKVAALWEAGAVARNKKRAEKLYAERLSVRNSVRKRRVKKRSVESIIAIPAIYRNFYLENFS